MTRRLSHTKPATLAAAVAGLALTLTACGGAGGGSGFDGEYYADKGQLVVEGSTVTYYPFECPEGPSVKRGDPIDPATINAEPDATGELSDEGDQVRWASDDEHMENDSIGGTTPITFEEWDSGNVVQIEGHEFVPGNEEEILQTHAEESCTTRS